MQDYGLEIDDDDAEVNVMREVVNITDEVVKFTIATNPGAKPLRYKLAPYGKPGDRTTLQHGYTQPYKGAGREMITPIIEKLTSRHVAGNEGDKLPMVVDSERAPEARAKWLQAHRAHLQSKAKKPVAITVEVDPSTLIPRSARIKAAPAAPLVGEEVAQDTIEPPHPDDDPIVADGPPMGGPEPEPEA